MTTGRRLVPAGFACLVFAAAVALSAQDKSKDKDSGDKEKEKRPKLTLTRTTATRLFAKLGGTHSFAGRSIYLQRRSNFGQWVTVEKLKLGPLSGRIFTAPHKKGTFTYRVYMTTNQAGAGYLDTWSNSVKVRYRR